MADVFISYSRKDKGFVQVLHQALTESNYDSWVDWEDIPLTADWWEEIKSGYEDGWREHNRLSGHTNDVNRLAISPDGETIASASRDHTIRLWDYPEPVNSVDISPDGTMLVIASGAEVYITSLEGEPIQTLLDLVTSEPQAEPISVVREARFSSDGQHVAILSQGSLLKIWHLNGERSSGLTTLTHDDTIQ